MTDLLTTSLVIPCVVLLTLTRFRRRVRGGGEGRGAMHVTPRPERHIHALQKRLPLLRRPKRRAANTARSRDRSRVDEQRDAHERADRQVGPAKVVATGRRK